jgi:hypothetical protein
MSVKEAPGELQDAEDIIDAGAVAELPELRFRAEKHRAETSRWLAFVIVALLAGSFMSLPDKI